jgi:hypothetical protein
MTGDGATSGPPTVRVAWLTAIGTGAIAFALAVAGVDETLPLFVPFAVSTCAAAAAVYAATQATPAARTVLAGLVLTGWGVSLFVLLVLVSAARSDW